MLSLHRRLIILTALVLLLSGCSRTGLLYANADWLAERWVSDLMDASDAQQENWRGLFALAMREHERDLLPEVIILLHELEDGTATGLTERRLGCLFAAADRAYRDHALWAVPAAAAVLRDISPQQIDHLAGELDERNREYGEDFLHPDPARRAQQRFERYVERVERWTGALTTKQLRLVRDAVGEMPDVAGDWLDYRRQQQGRLLGLLRAGAAESELRAFLAAWWVHFADRPDPLVDKSREVRGGWMTLILELQGALSAEQRALVRENLADLREDLQGAAEGLAGQQLASREAPSCRGDGLQLN